MAALGLVGAAAVGAAFAAASSPAAGKHVGLLNETGVASSCRARKPVPAATSEAVRFEAHGYANRSASSVCATVTVQPSAGEQLLASRTGLRSIAETPGARYLGDAGIWTNAAPELPRRVTYRFVVPPRTRFVVEVEPCRTIEVPPHTVEVRLRPLRR